MSQPFGRRLMVYGLVYGSMLLVCFVGLLIFSMGGFLGLWRVPAQRPLAEVKLELQSPETRTRFRALHTMYRFTPDPSDREVAEALLKIAQDEKMLTGGRTLAIKLLGEWGQPADADALATLENSGWMAIEDAAQSAGQTSPGASARVQAESWFGRFLNPLDHPTPPAWSGPSAVPPLVPSGVATILSSRAVQGALRCGP